MTEQITTYISPWTRETNRRLDEIKDLLSREYEDTSFRYVFSIDRIRPFGYATMPVIADYELFVTVKKISKKDSSEPTVTQNVPLGAVFKNAGIRQSIPFAEQFFEDTSRTINNIVVDGFFGRILNSGLEIVGM